MAVTYRPAPNKTVLESPLANAAIGYATGGQSGAIMRLVGGKNPALGKAMGATGVGEPAPEPDAAAKKPLELGSSVQAPASVAPESALSRRYAALSQDPQMTVLQGLDALKDPSIPDDLRQAYAEPLLRAKHYGLQRGMV